uniref:Putative conserved plasma membrane protein n=1 Tax=Ixodes ricinus TaxID=34613 RepID=A0A131XRZ1_IXORI
MTVSVTQNLRAFALSHPPLLVFTSCLVAFGVTMVALAYIIGGTDLPNPDIDLDWNVFLTRLSELHYCVGPRSPDGGGGPDERPLSLVNRAASVGPPPLPPAPNSTADVPRVKAVDRSKSLSALLPDLGASELAEEGPNVTVAVAVSATFFREALGAPVLWHGRAKGYMLGLSGKRAKEQLLMTLLLWPRSSNGSLSEQFCTGKHCRVVADTCLILQGPSNLLPKTKRPPRCFLEAVPPTTSRQVFLQRSAADTGGRVNCSGGIWTTFLYKPDPDLTVMLSYGDRSLVNLHLIHTSYFLFFMVMTLACYAVVRGRFLKVKMDKVLDA